MRKLATAAAVSLALASGGAFGLGLGDIEMESALNQPMSAEIELTSVQPGELDGIIVQLASEDAFARAGIERSNALSDLTFRVDQSSGAPVIKIESSRPIVEPFLNFLVEVDWRQGRLVREYTVLLDPPVFLSPSASERNTAADQPALVDAGESALVAPTPIERSQVAVDDGTDVGLSDLEDLATEPVLTLDEATGISANTATEGELVSLDSLTDDDADAIVTGAEGEIVSLTDLNAPNTDAIAEREAQAAETFTLSDVEVLGDVNETPDSFVTGNNNQSAAIEELEDGSTLVDLELGEIEELAQNAVNNGSTEVTVNNGDTLFEIAQDNVSGDVSVQQMMMAMLSANESAFINNNINLVRAGAILRVPDLEEANTLTQSQALAAVGEQNQLWQDFRDSLRAQADTQVAQTIESQAPATEQVASVDDNTDSSVADEAVEAIEAASLDDLSAEAQAILQNAREELSNREELKIIADSDTADLSASATADETENNDAARIGEVNRKLQMAREDLASTRLLSTDLDDQAGALESTTENLDAMVTLRQNEVARLEAQLADARNTAAQSAADNAAAQDAEQEAAQGVTGAVADAENSVGEATDNLVASAEDAVEQATDSAEQATDAIVDSGNNALTEAGKTLGEVALFDEDGSVEASETVAATDEAINSDVDAAVEGVETELADGQSWHEGLLQDPKRLAILGVGALGLLGVMGTLLFRRKKKDTDSDFDFADEEFEAAQFNDELPSAPDTASAASRLDGSPEFTAAGAAGVAGAAAVGGMAAGLGDKSDDAVDALDESFAQGIDSSELATSKSAMADHGHDDTLDKDDTISEVDVYLAYGLHGQAEELLTKAVESKPDNAAYSQRLLQTYHAQGNADAFHDLAQDFHQKFGGETNPQWVGIATMGATLKPEEALYSSAAGTVDKHNDVAASQLDADDFSAALDVDDGGSNSRGFGGVAAGAVAGAAAAGAAALGAASTEAQDSSGDESALMDESLDPAFAFDEADLEATGDFSAVSEDLVNQLSADGMLDADGLELQGLDDAENAVLSANDTLDELTDTGAFDPLSDDSLALNSLDDLPDSVNDLTLDIDQISGDMELESVELLNADLSDLDLPDLTAENDLLTGLNTTMGAGSDEMETMMDLAKAYIDMGDKDAASSALGEIVKSGSPDQVTEAESLLRNIS